MLGIEKQLNLLDYALSSLWRRRWKNISVLLIFSAVIFLIASFQMISSGLTNTAAEILNHAPEIVVQQLSAGRQEAISTAAIEKIDHLFGIRRVVPRIWGYYFDEANGANYTIVGHDPRKSDPGRNLQQFLAEGMFPPPDFDGGAVLGKSVHAVMELESRKHFSLFRPDLTLKEFTVSGIFDHQNELLTADLIVMSLADAADLFAIQAGKVTDLCVYVINPEEINTVAKKILQILPGTRVVTRPQIQKTYQVVFSWRSGFASICLLSALAAFSILAWDKASGLSPEEKKEVSILKIVGWQTADVLTCKFWESLLVAGIAFMIGCCLAYIHVAFFQGILFRPVMIGWSVIKPAFTVLPFFTLMDYLLIFCLTVLPYLSVTIIPSWKFAIVPADKAMN